MLRIIDMPDVFFGEGLALVDETLIQITWHNQIAIAYDRDTFTPLAGYPYEGEGWGLCYDEPTEKLYMSSYLPKIQSIWRLVTTLQ